MTHVVGLDCTCGCNQPIVFIPYDADAPGCVECGNDIGPYGGLCLGCLEEADEIPAAPGVPAARVAFEEPLT
jgi:hypothetical protein